MAESAKDPELRKLELEERKQKLDEDRHAFELKQYEDAKESREKALEKLKEEVLGLKRPFYANSSYLTPVATILVALVGGFFAFGTDFLHQNIAKLKGDQTKLRSDNKSLVEQNQSLANRNEQLLRRKAELETQLSIEAPNAILNVIRDSGDATDYSNPAYTKLTEALRKADEPSTAVDAVIKAHDNPAYPAGAKPEIDRILFEVTGDPKWKGAAVRDAFAGIHLGIDLLRRGVGPEDLGAGAQYLGLRKYFEVLRDPKVFGVHERTMSLETYFSSLKEAMKDVRDNHNAILMVEQLASWDPDALLSFPDAWRYAYEYVLPLPTGPYRLYDFEAWVAVSHQGAALRAIQGVTDPGSPFALFARFFAGYGFRFDPNGQCAFPAHVPLCGDFNVDWDNNRLNSRSQAYKDWLKQHPKQVSFWLANGGLERVSRLSQRSFSRVLHQEWVEDSELPD